MPSPQLLDAYIILAQITRKPKVIWEEPRRYPSLRESLWLLWDAHHLRSKPPLAFNDLHFHLIHPLLDRSHDHSE